MSIYEASVRIKDLATHPCFSGLPEKSLLLTYVASDLLRDDSPERALRGER
jgi:hypothetical protein